MIDFKKARINKAKKLLGELGPKIKAVSKGTGDLSAIITSCGDQLHAEDVLLYYLWNDQQGKPVIPWGEVCVFAYAVNERWPCSIVAELMVLGDVLNVDIPTYVQQGRRPTAQERQQHQTKIYKATLGTLY